MSLYSEYHILNLRSLFKYASLTLKRANNRLYLFVDLVSVNRIMEDRIIISYDIYDRCWVLSWEGCEAFYFNTSEELKDYLKELRKHFYI